MDGLDFVRVPDPLGGVPKWSHFYNFWREPILHNIGVDFVSIHMFLIWFLGKV